MKNFYFTRIFLEIDQTMLFIPLKIRVLLMLFQIFIFFIICFHTRLFTYFLQFSETDQAFQPSIEKLDEVPMEYSTRPPIVFNCSQSHRVSFTFDDGPHAIYTSTIVKTLRRQEVKAGFFVLGTSIQSFLSANNDLRVNQFERPRIGFLLLQDYSSIERLLEGHDIYLHGWLHEKNSEMRLQTVIDNISTQLIEIGLLKGFKPIYRAPWGIGTSPGYVNKKALITQILNQMGIIPALWDIDTNDYRMLMNEDNLINSTLGVICRKKGGQMLMHDNRPTTAYILDRMIRSIRASGHTIVSPGEINRLWNNQIVINRTRKYTEFLRERTRKIQNNRLIKTIIYRPVEISFPASNNQVSLLQCIDPLTRYEGSIKVTPNINNIRL
jgi:peptidoglycan/xylan/chitin deacetylase (PgdA/CDA1 family)